MLCIRSTVIYHTDNIGLCAILYYCTHSARFLAPSLRIFTQELALLQYNIMSYTPAHLVTLHGPDYEATTQQNPDFRVHEASDDGDGVSGDGGGEVVVGGECVTPPTDRGDGDDTRDAKVCIYTHRL